MGEAGLGGWDYAVLGTMLGVSVGVGVWSGLATRWGRTARERRKARQASHSAESFLMGDRRLPLLPVALSLLVSFQSAILILGSASEMYTRGSTYWWAWLGMGFSALGTSLIFVPVFYRLRLTSVYEYLEVRFGSGLLRRVGAGLYVLVTLFYLSIAIYAPSIALAGVTRIPLWALLVTAGLVSTTYVVLGGMKAVIWTDAIQAGFMLAGLLGVAVKGTVEVGGLGEVWRRSRQGGRLVYWDNSLDPLAYMTSWGIIFGQMFSWLGWYGINQSSVQRYCGMDSERKGQLALLLNIPGILVALSLVCYLGLLLYAHFEGCDPLRAGVVEDKDQLLPLFVLRVLGGTAGLPGLFLACLYSGTLSTLSSGLNSLAAVLWQDFLRPSPGQAGQGRRRGLVGRGLGGLEAETATRLLCGLMGLAATGLSFVAPLLGGVLEAALSLMGAVNGPLTGLFLLGVLVPWANGKGALAGAAVSLALCGWLCVGAHLSSPHAQTLPTSTDRCPASLNLSALQPLPEPPASAERSVYALSFALYDLLGMVAVVAVAVPVSWATGWEDVAALRPELFHPLVRRLGTRWAAVPSAVPSPASATPLVPPDEELSPTLAESQPL